MTEEFFFDSYALLDIIKGNPAYAPYTSAKIIMTKLNLFEVHYIVLRDFGQAAADAFLEQYSPFAVDYHEQVIRAAAMFKLVERKRELSMTDCIGYMLAQQFGIKFLTGDKEFEGRDNVEFVK